MVGYGSRAQLVSALVAVMVLASCGGNTEPPLESYTAEELFKQAE